MRAPDLTVCTASSLRGKNKSGRVEGFSMGHRQPDGLMFQKSLLETVENECPGLEWEIIAVQSANDPTVDDAEVSSTYNLAGGISEGKRALRW